MAVVKERGAAMVWRVGLEVLGYPATWATEGAEMMKLKRAIERLKPTIQMPAS